MFNIAIIGAGQLGSRHLQGLKKANLDMSIQVVDSSTESLAMAKSRYDEVADNVQIKKIEFLTDISSLADKLDLVVVATSSMPRAAIIEDLLSKKLVKNLVLEKFLFPSLEQYARIGKLVMDKHLSANTWVNCPRRMFDHYAVIKEKLASAGALEMVVDEFNWGLCCNSVHFIDIFTYLTGSRDWTFAVDPRSSLTDSKRSGYVELKGAIVGHSGRGDKITLIDTDDQQGKPLTIKRCDGSQIIIDEANCLMTDGNQQIQFATIYQSGLTNILAEDILVRNQCRLTPYDESATLHIAFLAPVVEFFNKVTGNDSDSCPIT